MSVELETSEALLDIGVSLPCKTVKIPFTGKGFTLRMIMKRPCLGNQMRIARHYLKTGVTYEQMKGFNKHEEMVFLAMHGTRISKIIALTICRGAITGTLFTPFMAWFIRWFVPDAFIMGANLRFITLLGTKDFMNIIRSSEIANPMRPRLSQEKRKGS